MTAESRIGETAIDSLANVLSGRVIRPSDAEYDDARKVWNGMIDKRPGAIAQCASADDVVAAVRFAGEHDLTLAVRGGGHNVAGRSVCDDGLVVDFSLMQDVSVDTAAGTAKAGPGATWSVFDAATHAHGLATTGGVISSTGVSGLTLGGGIGWLARSYGLCCDNLMSAEVVTADGRRLRASGNQHEDLFWAIRGGGGNFGVVTSLEYRLHPLRDVVAGMVVHPVQEGRAVLEFYREYACGIPDHMSTIAALLTTPDGVAVCAVAVVYYGPPGGCRGRIGSSTELRLSRCGHHRHGSLPAGAVDARRGRSGGPTQLLEVPPADGNRGRSDRVGAGALRSRTQPAYCHLDSADRRCRRALGGGRHGI